MVHKITPKVRAYIRRFAYELIELMPERKQRSEDKRSEMFDDMTQEEQDAANRLVLIIFKRYC